MNSKAIALLILWSNTVALIGAAACVNGNALQALYGALAGMNGLLVVATAMKKGEAA